MREESGGLNGGGPCRSLLDEQQDEKCKKLEPSGEEARKALRRAPMGFALTASRVPREWLRSPLAVVVGFARSFSFVQHVVVCVSVVCLFPCSCPSSIAFPLSFASSPAIFLCVLARTRKTGGGRRQHSGEKEWKMPHFVAHPQGALRCLQVEVEQSHKAFAGSESEAGERAGFKACEPFSLYLPVSLGVVLLFGVPLSC